MNGQKYEVLRVICFVILSGVIGCRDNSTNSPYSYDLTDLRTAIPLKEGASWDYRLISSLDSSRTLDTLNYTQTILRSFDSLSTKYFVVQDSAGDPLGAIIFDNHLETVTSNRYSRYSNAEINGQTTVISKVYLQQPIRIGARWYADGKDDSLGDFQITNIDTAISVVGNTYQHVIMVTLMNIPPLPFSVRDDIYMAPGVGIVREISSVGPIMSTIDLIGFSNKTQELQHQFSGARRPRLSPMNSPKENRLKII